MITCDICKTKGVVDHARLLRDRLEIEWLAVNETFESHGWKQICATCSERVSLIHQECKASAIRIASDHFKSRMELKVNELISEFETKP